MVMRSAWWGVPFGIVAITFLCSTLIPTFAADAQDKKPKAAPESKTKKPKSEKSTTGKSKTDKSKFTSAETASKADACFGSAPKIDKVSPDEGKAGDTVTITGKDFGSAECLRSVSFGPGNAATFKIENATKITATVPSGGRKGLAILTVTTASGQDSKPFLVK
jgi:hypothetical protein